MKWRDLLAGGLVLATTVALPAAIGENIKQIKARMGEPGPQASKRNVIWLFEEGDGRMAYSVTLNDKDISIAEGLKPIEGAVLDQQGAQDFTISQLAPYKGVGTTRGIKPGEKYVFAGKSFTCGANEVVVVNDEAGVLIIWTKGKEPKIMAVGHELAAKL
jgi:hypothetical protein